MAAGSGRAIQANRLPRPVSHGALYEYTGATGMTVTGSASGMKYRFGQPGSKVQIDSRDVSSMAGLPNLRRV
ncbi:MAG: hypothetical protein WBY44_29145 [Bryobacteraceae bacterium]